jgi:hypothetical protein
MKAIVLDPSKFSFELDAVRLWRVRTTALVSRSFPRGAENGVVGVSEPGSLAHCVDDNCDVNGNSCSSAGHVHQESPAASLLNGGYTVSA